MLSRLRVGFSTRFASETSGESVAGSARPLCGAWLGGLLAAFALLVASLATPVFAGGHREALVYPNKIPQPALAQAAPDVQVLIVSEVNGVDEVNITYPSLVPRAQAVRDLSALASVSSWPIGDIQMQNSAMNLIGVKAAPMTSVTFAAKGAVRKEQKWFLLEPFVVALRPYRKLTISYMVPKTFTFAGLHDYSDTHVHISLQQHGLVYTYKVAIDNPNFNRLNLPLLQSPMSATGIVRQAALPQRERSLRALRLAGIVLIGALAVLVGFGVYAVLSRAA
ncbi:MAG TPA: hypothetical protein VFW40_09155 [Capsulimonadaceae bacterium]|nr:hypothetical protein [Capsulimonadaceae bacterium]